MAWNGLVADILGDVRVRVTPTGTDDDVFVGIARDRTSTRTSPESRGRPWSPRATASARCPDRAPSTPPEDAAIWELVSVGQGGQELVWTPRTGRWSMVVMNPDAGSGVSVEADAGATVPWLTEAGVAMLLTGVVVLLAGAILIAVGVRRAGRTSA